MKESPILFSGPMVRAILEGRKTQTRRVIKFPKHTYDPIGEASWIKSVHQDGGGNWVAWSTAEPGLAEFTKKAYPNGEGFKCLYGVPGDRLWVRETFAEAGHDLITYKADGTTRQVDRELDNKTSQWRPSIFMPRWASRITLEITSIGVQRLQDITEADAIAEGVTLPSNPVTMYPGIYRDAYAHLWDSLNAKRGHSWATNPWAWVIEFRKV